MIIVLSWDLLLLPPILYVWWRIVEQSREWHYEKRQH